MLNKFSAHLVLRFVRWLKFGTSIMYNWKWCSLWEDFTRNEILRLAYLCRNFIMYQASSLPFLVILSSFASEATHSSKSTFIHNPRKKGKITHTLTHTYTGWLEAIGCKEGSYIANVIIVRIWKLLELCIQWLREDNWCPMR